VAEEVVLGSGVEVHALAGVVERAHGSTLTAGTTGDHGGFRWATRVWCTATISWTVAAVLPRVAAAGPRRTDRSPAGGRRLSYSSAVRALGGLVLAAVVLTAAGCTTPADQDSSPQPPADSSAPALPPDYSVAEALAQVPLQVRRPDAPFTITTASLTEASEVAGVDRPIDLAGVPEWLADLTGRADVYVPLEIPLAPSAPAAMVEADLRWSVLDVDRFLMWESRGEMTTAVAGAFDDQTLAALPSEGGIHSAGAGRDLEGTLEEASPARPQGEPLRMAVAHSWLMASPRTEVTRTWLRGSAPTLLDDPVLAGLADLLDKAGVHAARIMSPPRWTPSSYPAPVVEALGLTRASFPRFDAYAAGWTTFQGQQANVVVYHDADGRGLEQTRRLVQERWEGTSFRGTPWAELVTLLRVDVVGEHVVAQIIPEDPTMMDQIRRFGDLPVMTW
jgi:hypothetical protein